MEGNAYTQNNLVPSNLTPEGDSNGDYPVMGLMPWVSVMLLPDLVGEFSSIGFRYPPDPGATLQGEVGVTVTNIGGGATEPKQAIDMAFFLRPIEASNDSEDILVCTLHDITIGKLAPGTSKRIDASVPMVVPAFTYGTFKLVVYIDSSNAVMELYEDNNTAVTTGWIVEIYSGIPEIHPDLIGEFTKISFRGSFSPGATIRAEIDVNNVGNIATAPKQVIDIQICLRQCNATDDTDDISLMTLRDQSVGNLGPNSSKTFRATFKLPAILDVGEYKLVAKVDSSEAVEELVEDNNEALSACFEFLGE
jgi:hypothetical protein